MVPNYGKLLRMSAVLMTLSAALLGCAQEAECKQSTRRIDNIARVFMHQPKSYSFLIHFVDSDDGYPIFNVVRFEDGKKFSHYLSIVFVADVAPENPMWAREEFVGVAGENCIYSAEIHIHSPADISGAGWNHGKSGSGQTNVVE
ncbi:hypothetical protein HY633_04635 [Candidatus Uhrbacteria bacterium]|nr:hypothetical protein [Candidatus Uhrbacteria bacterium]